MNDNIPESYQSEHEFRYENEFSTDIMTITIKIRNSNIERKYVLIDGFAPEDMEEKIQDMIDTLFDRTEI